MCFLHIIHFKITAENKQNGLKMIFPNLISFKQ